MAKSIISKSVRRRRDDCRFNTQCIEEAVKRNCGSSVRTRFIYWAQPITKLKTNDGIVISSQSEILGEAERFYRQLYRSFQNTVAGLVQYPRSKTILSCCRPAPSRATEGCLAAPWLTRSTSPSSLSRLPVQSFLSSVVGDVWRNTPAGSIERSLKGTDVTLKVAGNYLMQVAQDRGILVGWPMSSRGHRFSDITFFMITVCYSIYDCFLLLGLILIYWWLHL